MTDRELLEAAAKAAGLCVLRSRLGDPMWNDMLLDCRPDFPQTKCWNPLTDDGDALRLAWRLRLNIEPQSTMSGKPAGFNVWPTGRGDCGCCEDGSEAHDLRRAIVRAAAAMVKP